MTHSGSPSGSWAVVCFRVSFGAWWVTADSNIFLIQCSKNTHSHAGKPACALPGSLFQPLRNSADHPLPISDLFSAVPENQKSLSVRPWGSCAISHHPPKSDICLLPFSMAARTE